MSRYSQLYAACIDTKCKQNHESNFFLCAQLLFFRRSLACSVARVVSEWQIIISVSFEPIYHYQVLASFFCCSFFKKTHKLITNNKRISSVTNVAHTCAQSNYRAVITSFNLCSLCELPCFVQALELIIITLLMLCTRHNRSEESLFRGCDSCGCDEKRDGGIVNTHRKALGSFYRLGSIIYHCVHTYTGMAIRPVVWLLYL